MKITAKQIDRSNVVIAFPDGVIPPPEASKLFPLYTEAQSKGAMFSDNPSTATKVFDFPAAGLQWVFEPGRVRLEDKKHRSPDESKLPAELVRVMEALYAGALPVGYGFNYDMIYRMDTVIPMKDIMGSFLKPESIEDVRHFGWQYTLSKEKGKRLETYFLKAVSPIELAVHANFHFNDIRLPDADDLQKAFERSYANADGALSHLAF